MRENINLNFLELTPQTFEISFYKKIKDDETLIESKSQYYNIDFYEEEEDCYIKYIISFEFIKGFEKQTVKSDFNIDLTKEYLFYSIGKIVNEQKVPFVKRYDYEKRKRYYFILQNHREGSETVWIEPYYLESQKKFGFLLDYKFVVDATYKKLISGSVDKKILKLSGTLDSYEQQNRAFYQFKYNKIQKFILNLLPKIQLSKEQLNISDIFTEISYSTLSIKKYIFNGEKEDNSTFMGLKNNKPYKSPTIPVKFLFIFKSTDKNHARKLFLGLKGDSFPQFSGMKMMFDMNFTNSEIMSKEVSSFDSVSEFATIIDEIKNINDQDNVNIIPIILTNSNQSKEDDMIYYKLKHLFISNGIPCQITTKNLLNIENSFKYSICNIGLQIFAKSGGMPWKVKPANEKCLIIGIGNKHKIITKIDENGVYKKTIEKYQTYSVLTDSSGLFREIEILSEANEEEDYYTKLKDKMISIIKKVSEEGINNVVIHTPFRISKDKVWDKVFNEIPKTVTVSIIIINDKHKYFGYNLNKNSLVPYESSVIKISHDEFLIWFEGVQYQNVNINKLIGAPVYIKLWYSNNSEYLHDKENIKKILQDCINLSGANWRGFKAKQLPVSIFYCQRIAEFLQKFEEYEFNEIKIQNLKPWFL